MNKNPPLIFAGIIFAFVALAHLLRLIYHWEVYIAGQSISMTFSVGSFILASVLAIWMFVAASKN